MVAAQFRKEVTSTVLWLLKHEVRVECFKATPFQLGDQILLSLEQIIPLPEAEELMIGIAEKEKEEHATERVLATRQILCREFWTEALAALEKAEVELYVNVGPTKDNWLSAGSGLAGVHYSMVFSKEGARVELVFSRGTKAKNKAMFDLLHPQRHEIESTFGGPLEWRRLEEYKGSIIAAVQPFDGYGRENWPAMIAWLVQQVKAMERTFEPIIPTLRQFLRTQFPKSNVRETI